MDQLESRASDFGDIVREIIKQFQQLHDSTASGPYANLGHNDMRAIEFLGESGAQMMRVLAEHLGLAVNSITPIVDGLELRGLAHRLRSSTDRRVINVELTEQGLEAFHQVSGSKRQFHRALLSALTQDEQEILLVLFRKIAREGWQQVQKLSAQELV